jgi:hypothetical protein
MAHSVAVPPALILAKKSSSEVPETLMDSIRNINWTRLALTFIVCANGERTAMERNGARRGRLTFPGQPWL